MANVVQFKVDPEPFQAMWRKEKKADLRDLSDRKPEKENIPIVGSLIEFQEFDRHAFRYSGRQINARVTHIQRDYILGQNQVMISFKIVELFSDDSLECYEEVTK